VSIRRLFAWFIASVFLAAAPAAPPARGAAKKSPPGASAKKSAPAAKSKRKGSAVKSASKSKRPGARRAQARRQQAPEPERIREIQQALKDRGYDVEPTGVWGPETIEALKKFQEDRNIENLSGRGKLDSLTLIALGLGPKRETSQEAPPQPPTPQEGKTP
jgi:peptidoglycan hydrolase-like protein with peptidoglycan-binding domain